MDEFNEVPAPVEAEAMRAVCEMAADRGLPVAAFCAFARLHPQALITAEAFAKALFNFTTARV